ncbi:MAG: GspE/PulE family protein [Campylobacterota bacterium]|nr:GspE/PulE family protein [Campylobacterota bacterium]
MSNNLLEYNIDYDLVKNIDKELLIDYNIMPIHQVELFLLIATTDISQDIEPLVKIFNKSIKLIEVEKKSLEFEWQYLDFKLKLFSLANSAINNMDIDKENSYIIKFIDELFIFSIENNVSDIHYECLDKSIIIRFRIDGQLNQFFRFDISLYQLISSIIKYFGNLDIAQKRLPLNARFSRKVDNKSYDVRVSTMPTIYGESIVLRILDNGNVQKDLNQIGFEKSTLHTIEKNLKLTQGLILVTGPTGSGKTTTLYSMLNALNSKEKKIITIEDPVEYKLDGVMQVNINNEIDLNYHIVLKNILRQDPDILMIGEIRDSESLQTAMQAALTGHLVIATLHTNSAIETITRLLDLKSEPYLIASTLKMVLSQRLLRILCSVCKVKDKEDNSYKSEGCVKCNFTGYKGRKVVSEILTVDEDISNVIATNHNIVDITKLLEDKNFTTINANGKKLVENGLTSLSEYYSKV